MFTTFNAYTSTNFLLTHTSIWGMCFFFLTLYVLLWSTIIFYTTPNIPQFVKGSTATYTYVTGSANLSLLVAPLLVLLFLLLSWSGPTVVAWYGHVIFANWQYRLSYVILVNFFILLVAYSTSLYFSSSDVYDYYIVMFNFFFWVFYLFYVNNIFTFIFFIEIISTLIILLLTTSTFSSSYFYNLRSLSQHSYFQSTTPITFFRSILFFFWISLVGSLNLFVFLTLFYLKVLTFDWFLTESLVFYLLTVGSLKSLFVLLVVWLVLMFCIFLKCGLVPFYFWKPTFFKGMSLHSLFFYIYFFYFNLLLFLTYFLLVYMNELFTLSIAVNLSLLLFGIITVFFILFESYYVKAFLALSSILNTLFLFLGLTSFHVTDIYFLL